MSKKLRKIQKSIDVCDYIKDIMGEFNDLGVDCGNLSTAINDLESDLNNKYKEELEKEKSEMADCIKPGNLFSISGGDGISYHSTKYYKVKEITKKGTEVVADIITVTFGDYGNSISFDKEERTDLDSIVESLRKNYHETEKDLTKEWEIYEKYCNEIPEIKE